MLSSSEQLGAVERSRQKYKAAPLTVEFVPFFYRKFYSTFLISTSFHFRIKYEHQLNMNFVFVKTWQISAQQCFRCIIIMYVGSMEDLSLTKSGCDHGARFSSSCLQRCFSLPLPVLPLFSPLYQLFVSTLCLLGTEDKLIANRDCQTMYFSYAGSHFE